MQAVRNKFKMSRSLEPTLRKMDSFSGGACRTVR